MASFLGLDTDAVRQGAAILNSVAATIAEGQAAVNAVLQNVQWAGPDGDHARQEFEAKIRPAMNEVRKFLEDTAVRMSTNASAQDQASGA